MYKKKFISTAKNVINFEIEALQKLKKNINKSFCDAVIKIAKCQSKVILCGVGKSGLIAAKIASTFASVGTPSFSLAASEASHGDLGMISKKDLLILISYSGKTNELKNIIQYANRNKIFLIGIMSRKDSLLYEASDIKLLIPQVQEAGEIIPTASTTTQLAIGDALAITTMNYRKFGKVDFKKLHPSGSLGSQLITVSDIMQEGNKIPFVNENIKMINALRILSKKKLGILIAQNKYKKTTGIITDGQIRRFNEKQNNINELKVKDLMTSNPISINKNQLAAKALALMNEKKITSLCVYDNTKKTNTIGVVHIHDILQSNIS